MLYEIQNVRKRKIEKEKNAFEEKNIWLNFSTLKICMVLLKSNTYFEIYLKHFLKLLQINIEV